MDRVVLAQLQGWADEPLVNRAGLSPAARAGLMFQPETKRGWTQPGRAGGADVPARSKKRLDSAQPHGLG